jgi:hypothetical protein
MARIVDAQEKGEFFLGTQKMDAVFIFVCAIVD